MVKKAQNAVEIIGKDCITGEVPVQSSIPSESYPFQGIIPDGRISGAAVSDLVNVVRALVRLMKDGASCDLRLRLRGGEFTQEIGISKQRVRLGSFGLQSARKKDEDDLIKKMVAELDILK